MIGSAAGRERVSSGRTRVSLLSREFRLIAIVLSAATALLWSGAFGPLSSRDLSSLTGHTRLVEAVTFSPDGRTLASCGYDHTIRLWDTSRWSGGEPAEPEVLAHSSVVFGTAFSSDGSLLAAVGDRFVILWSCRPTYQKRAELVGETYRAVAFSPDGRTLALGSEDGKIRLLEVPSMRDRMTLHGHVGTVRGLAFSPDGKLLVSGGQEGRVVAWDVATGIERRVLVPAGPAPIQDVVFSPDGRSVCPAEHTSAPSEVPLYDLETGAVRARLPGHPLGVHDVAFSRDGRFLATAGIDHIIRLFDVATAKEVASLKEDRSWLKSIAFSPDGSWLAFARGDESIGLWDMRHRPPSDGSGSRPPASPGRSNRA
jgi:WD40 repeat protein